MAGNEWINGYLEAILDAGGAKLEEGQERRSVEMVGGGVFNLTKYFVEEVVTGFDESDLYRTWIKVIATRNSRERNNRLENMCWRIWHLARKKKQIECDDARRLAKRRQQREQGRKDAAADLSEDLSEGEKDSSAHGDSVRGRMSRIGSDLQSWTEDDEDKRLYIVLISLHGLVRGENMELGRDSDTGGQVKYVVELARALAATKGVYRVDLLTRQISSPDVDWSYGEPTEMLTRQTDGAWGDGDGSGAYIVRLPCGPRDKYIPKESLWPHIPEFVDAALVHVSNMARALGEQRPRGGSGHVWPYVIHGHYADAGEVAARLSGALNVPMVLTGHSLGRNKFEQLLKQGRLSKEDINNTYKIMRRIEAEEYSLDSAEMVVTSTRQEIEEQWGLYDGFDVNLERKLRARSRRGVSCHGRYMPRMVVIPPGMDFSYVNTQELLDGDADIAALIGSDRNQSKRNLPPIWSEIMRFFTNRHKPMILALSRPDPKKNVTTLLKAFGECRPLRELANMTLILGNRDDIEEMSGTSSSVLTTVLKLIDKYDLYGQVAYPKRHKQAEVPEIYRLAAKTKGVFINPALVEPFGLTLIEAAAYGLPVVATKNGGPVDIIKALNNGLLVNPHDHKAIADALLRLVSDKSLWQDCRKNGLRNISRFSWPEHCRNYLSHVAHCRARRPNWRGPDPSAPTRPTIEEEEPMSDSLRDVQDLSIRFSLDVDVVKANGDGNGTSKRELILDALRSASRSRGPSQNPGFFRPGRRQRLFVIALDCYGQDGAPTGRLPEVVRVIMEAGGDSRTGYILATGATLAEAWEALKSCHVEPEAFDALICCSGGEVYYPWKDVEGDEGYGAHIGYRWPEDGVRSAVARLARTEGGAEDDVVAEDEGCSSRCFRYAVRAGAKVLRVDDLKQRLRMRGFRCSVVYTHSCSRLNVVPLFASRSMALRYLSVQWSIDLSKMVVFVGDRGDTDYEHLLPGLHKTFILRGTVEYGSERLLRGSGRYQMDDVVPKDGPNMCIVDEGYTAQHISAALIKL
ncbi:unnamed protein product [Victoria cruziana]